MSHFSAKLLISFFVCIAVILRADLHAEKKSETKGRGIKLVLIDYEPLMSPTMPGFGIEPQIVTAVFTLLNINIKYKFLPTARAIETTKKGKYNGLVGFVWSKEREESFYYSEPVFEAPLVFFHLKQFQFDWNTMKDLRGINIGTVLKNYYGPSFHKAWGARILKVQEVSKDELNYAKLLARRIKLMPMNIYSGYANIRKKYPPETAKQFTHHPKPLKTSVYHVIFPKKDKSNKLLAEEFSTALSQLKKTGDYDRIVSSFKLKTN